MTYFRVLIMQELESYYSTGYILTLASKWSCFSVKNYPV